MNKLKRGIPIGCDVKLSSKLTMVQRRAQKRTATLSEIQAGLGDLYEQLQCHLYKKDIIGIIVSFDPNAQNFPSEYKYTPYGTQVLAKRTSKGWSILKIERGAVQPKRFKVYGLESRQDALAKFATQQILTKVAS